MAKQYWRALLVTAAATTVAGAIVWGLLTSGRPAPPDSELGPDSGPHVVVQLLRDPAPVPAFTVTDLSGRSMSTADWRGKVVLINFWATWCAPCRAEIPDLVRLQDKYRDQLVIIGVSEDHGPTDLVRRFADEHKVNYPIVMSSPELEKIFPGIMALPTTFLLDREGRLVQKRVGLLNARHTEATTRALAGLPVNATVERVEDPGRLSAAGIAEVSEVPGVDFSKIPAEEKAAALQALNAEKCPCGCDLSVAKCRIDDPQCTYSLPAAQEIAARFAGRL